MLFEAFSRPLAPQKKLIVSDIWCFGKTPDQCAFPSQIRFRLHSSFRALPKNSEFAPLFLRRMKVKGKFLDRARVRSLISALTNYHEVMNREHQHLTNLLRNCLRDNYGPYPLPNYHYPYDTMNVLQEQNDFLRMENRTLRNDRREVESPRSDKLPYNVNAIAHFKNQSPREKSPEISDLFEAEPYNPSWIPQQSYV